MTADSIVTIGLVRNLDMCIFLVRQGIVSCRTSLHR